jgi:hypothetical protein
MNVYTKYVIDMKKIKTIIGVGVKFKIMFSVHLESYYFGRFKVYNFSLKSKNSAGLYDLTNLLVETVIHFVWIGIGSLVSHR